MRLDMVEMAGQLGVKWTGRLLNVCMHEGRIPQEWRMGLIDIVPIWKRKGDVHDPRKYRGTTLLSQVLKLLEEILDARNRRRVEGDSGEEQQEYRKGRVTANGMFLVLSYVYSKQPMFGLTQEWFRELSFSRLECGVHDRLNIIYPLCGIFHLPWHRHQIEETNGFLVSHPKDRDTQSLM